MKRILTIFASAAVFALSCTGARGADSAQGGYTVTIPLSADEDGLKAYIVDFDNDARLDSTIVADGKAVFKGSVAKPVLARIFIDGNRAGTFALEPGAILVEDNGRKVSGTPVNDAMTALSAQKAQVAKQYMALPETATPEERKALQNKYDNLSEKAFVENIDNPLGFYLFLQKAYEWNLPEFEAQLRQYPQFASSKRLAKLKEGLLNKEATSPGHMFKDFTVTYDGTTKKLSDYVGKGRYTLVDFWASWCGPCIRETQTLKKLYEKYNGKGLDFLGVAVWDEPANTLKAIETHSLPWPQILNSGNIATDIYGIPGIPCIILFDPEGRIVSRDKQGEELIADVDAAMSAVPQAQ